MTTSQGPSPVLSDTETLLIAERNHSSDSTLMPPPTNDTLSNGLSPLITSGSKQNGHSNNGSGDNDDSEVVHHGSNNDHPTANGKVFDSEVYVLCITHLTDSELTFICP